jgi:hypothetical protein
MVPRLPMDVANSLTLLALVYLISPRKPQTQVLSDPTCNAPNRRNFMSSTGNQAGRVQIEVQPRRCHCWHYLPDIADGCTQCPTYDQTARQIRSLDDPGKGHDP